MISVIVVWRYYAITNNLATYGYTCIRTDFRFDSPLIGCTIVLLERIKTRLFMRFNSSPFHSDLCLLTATILLIGWIYIQLEIGKLLGVDSTVTSLIAGIFIISQIFNYNNLGKRFFTVSPLVSIGKISYGVYL